MPANAKSAILKVLQWVLLLVGVLSLVVGLALIHLASREEAKTASRNAMVQSGEIGPVDAVVSGKRIRESTSSKGVGRRTSRSTSRDYEIVVSIGDVATRVYPVNGTQYQTIRIGEAVDAYPIDGGYFVPRFESDYHGQVKWLIFAMSSVPMLGAIAMLAARRMMAARERSREAHIKSNAL